MGQCCSQVCEFLSGRDLERQGFQGARDVELAAVRHRPQKPAASDRRALDDENKAHREVLKFLARVRLFQRLPKSDHPLLAAACVQTTYTAGQVVIRQGEPGTELFVVRRGEADVYVSTMGADGKNQSPRLVDTLHAGDYFGETALIADAPRTATIVAKSTLETLRLRRDKFIELGLGAKFRWPKRKAVGGMGTCSSANLPRVEAPTAKSPTDRAMIAAALRSNAGLQIICDIEDNDCCEQLADVAWMQSVRSGEDLITEGDLKADYFYVVRTGSFSVVSNAGYGSFGESPSLSSLPIVTSSSYSSWTPTGSPGGLLVPPGSPGGFSGSPRSPESLKRSLSKEYGSPVGRKTVGPGGSFGELALLYLSPRSATVRADVDSTVWVIDRGNFKRILMKASEDRLAAYMNILARVGVFATLSTEDVREVAKALVELYYVQGEAIVQQGEPGNTFYILYEGEVAVIEDGNELRRMESEGPDGPTPFFGERALVNAERRTASVVVTSENARVLALDRETIDLLLGSEIFQNSDEVTPRRTAYRRPKLMSMDNRDAHEHIPKAGLKRIGLLGFGGFGTVELCEYAGTGRTFALKMLSKGYIVKSGMQKSVISEKEVLLATKSPFIIRLYECYNDTERLYFLLEAALGGELFTVYRVKGFHGKWEHAKFYVAGVVIAFEHLHERRIVYRDLKPENLLLDHGGRPKLTDMGLAKFVVGKTFTACGTPDYFAPEVISGSGHNAAVDWWTLGILLFELLSGSPPFEAKQPMAIYTNVMAGIESVRFPLPCQAPAVKTLIQGLLRRDPSERLPLRQGGTANIRKHAWYASFGWEAFENLTLAPPYLPVVASPKDAANFHASEHDAPKLVPYKDPGTGWDEDFET